MDTGDLDKAALWKPTDATTNPRCVRLLASAWRGRQPYKVLLGVPTSGSLLLKASTTERFKLVAMEALASAAARTPSPGQLSGARGKLAGAADALAVAVGNEILKLVPGRVSTEADARLAFDTQGTIERAERLIALYEASGTSRDRVLIKIESTWEGIRAVETLEQLGIACNCTLLFSFAQAVACADAGATLISPFVGRILDWHIKHEGREFSAENDPGVLAVTRIYNYFKAHHLQTTVMAASFRNADEIRLLAGCDAITVSPALLELLGEATNPLERKLSPETAPAHCHDARTAAAKTKPEFEAALGTGMARDKLEEGVAIFAREAAAPEDWLRELGKA